MRNLTKSKAEEQTDACGLFLVTTTVKAIARPTLASTKNAKKMTTRFLTI